MKPAPTSQTASVKAGRYSAIFEIGQAYLIHTVTQFQVGRVTAVHDDAQMLTLDDAAWIADTGRFSSAVKNSDALNEIEPVGRMFVNIAGIIDAVPVSYELPLEARSWSRSPSGSWSWSRTVAC